ncbi:FtsX-like permease family protein [Rhodoferax sp. OV413]|uniref:FtsX-like permease family protein n=1 Tax=Rhodoferax sp. OV413 TaxID=1855285 RepID=UPI000B84718C|nr:ABC transporter permease [Rhodoferax sp. OV413]
MQDRRALRNPNRSAVRSLLASFSWQELVHHPWRNAAAVVAVMLGVALAFSVHLINASALSEFSSAVSAAGGQPDLELRATQGQFDEAIYTRIAGHTDVALASPVLELSTLVTGQDGRRQLLKVLGVDALVVAAVAPGLMPVPDKNAERLALLAPDTLFLNPAAQQLLTSPVQLQNGLSLRVAGSVGATGPPLAVMDIGAAQQAFGRLGQLSRIDLRLRSGVDRATFIQALSLPPGITAAEPGDAAQRISNLSRAYRVNLTVLALVALFTGAFLVFSVLSLSVAKRAQQFALLGVLGLTGRERLQLVLWESLVLGSIGSLAGIALGTGLAALALRLLGGDLGGGYFAGVAPRLQWDGLAALVYGALGVAAALVGGWWPARAAQRLPPAQTLKGLGADLGRGHRHGLSLALVLLGVLLALAPPVFGIPLGAYLSVALLLVGGITALPWLIAALYDRLAPLLAHRLLPMLAIERARRVRQSAAVAVSGVVASLSLAVALTVMVASFRDSMVQWLDVVLPADLYVRTATASAGNDAQTLPPSLVQAVAQIPGVQRVATQRTRALLLDPGKPSVTLIARQIGDPARSLPLVGAALPVPPGQIGIYVSEPMVDLYGAQPGTTFTPLLKTFEALPQAAPAPPATFFVAGVWRDYARQFGAISLEQADFVRLTGDASVNDMALWLGDGAREADVQQAIRALSDAPLEFSSVSQIRATSLKIFDRSFAVTYWLQAVAIAIGLFGVAASFSAQVLARRKEFGLLAHLGLTQRQILAVVAGEGAAWTLIGSVAGLALGLAVSMVLVFVVNPQSFHWTMDLHLPWPRLLALCAAVVLAGTVTAWLAGRAAAGHDAVLAVKEDW